MIGDWSQMAVGQGLGHWIAFALLVAAILYPIGRVLRRIGFSPLWSVLTFVPLINLLALWILAFIAWPERTDRTAWTDGGRSGL